jgi:hypothetical protein
VMFEELERIVVAHRLCGKLTGHMCELTATGYPVQLTCCCGASFERWVTPEMADHDLLRSRLLALPN